MKKTILPFFILIMIAALFNLKSTMISAQGFSVRLNQPQGYGVTSGIGADAQAEGIVATIITNVIIIFFIVGGLGTVVYFIWGSVDWILSGGDKEKIANARKKMTHAIIGLVLLALSYTIINIVGGVVGFNPLGDLQLRGLGDSSTPRPNQ